MAVPFLGINLSTLDLFSLLEKAKKGGLFLAPSGPGLALIDKDNLYFEACKKADIVLPDSGLAIFLCRLLGLGNLPRVSGLGFLKYFFESYKTDSDSTIFWVFPSETTREKVFSWLITRGLKTEKNLTYIAPFYSRLSFLKDDTLLKLLEISKPNFLFICIGSGPQEKLGSWLIQNLSYRPAIICIGAAIGFLSGDQVRIPSWADRFCLGWLFRCVSDPFRFVPRYTKALRLIYLAIRFRQFSPS